MDIYAIVGLDAVDGLQLGAQVLAVALLVLIVGTTGDDGSFELRTFENAKMPPVMGITTRLP